MTTPHVATFSLKRVQEVLGLSRGIVDALVEAGFVQPQRGARNALRFTLQDLMLLRTAYALQQAAIPPRRILRALARLRERLPAELPLTGLRISAVGAEVVVRDPHGRLEADSGQLLMDFEVESRAGSVSFLDVPRREAEVSPREWFGRGEAAEASDPAAAEAAYRAAIAGAPSSPDAYLNLGAMLCHAGRCDDAVALYDEALRHCGDEALIHFNRAIALEDQGRPFDAIESYRRSLALSPQLADAHYNAAMLLEQIGDEQAALRHYSAYRRLTRGQEAPA